MRKAATLATPETECLLYESYWFRPILSELMGQPLKRRLSIEIVRLVDLLKYRCPLSHRNDHKEASASLAVLQRS